MFKFLMLLGMSTNLAFTYTIVSNPLPEILPVEEEEPGLMIEPPPEVNISDIAPIIKIPDEIPGTDVEPLRKDTEPNESSLEDTLKFKHIPVQTPIPHTGNIDNANLLEYSAPNLNGNGNKNKQIKTHTGRDDENSIDYNDYVTVSIDVFKQQNS